MTEIPEDIQKAAWEILYDYPPIVRQVRHDIERAILAERERCASIIQAAAAQRDTFTVQGRKLKGHSGDEIFIAAGKIDDALAEIRSPANKAEPK